MTKGAYKLVIGNKMWSSWSLRPWLLMRHFGLPFTEVAVPLRTPGTTAAIKAHSPSGKIPALIDDGFTVWDTLAIIEYLADSHPELAIWPPGAKARAIARAISAEMHSGFMPLRQNCPMDIHARGLAPADPNAIAADVTRIVEIWRTCRTTYGGNGPFLFSDFTAADAMFAPVVSRFQTYDCALSARGDDGTAASYMATIAALPAMAEWAHAAISQPATRNG